MMDDILQQCYLQTIYIRHEEHSFKSILCLIAIPLGELRAHAPEFLHQNEMDYFLKLKFEKRQHDYLQGHFAAKVAVNAYGDTYSLQEIFFDYGVFRFPIIYHPGYEKIQITNSHSGKWCAALAHLEALPMGIDLETINIKKNKVIETQLTKNEIELITKYSSLYPNAGNFYTYFWTLKEALSKVLRTGMTVPFELYEIKEMTQNDDNSWTSHFTNFHQYQGRSFLMGEVVCSIVYPKKSIMSIDIKSIRDWALEKSNG